MLEEVARGRPWFPSEKGGLGLTWRPPAPFLVCPPHQTLWGIRDPRPARFY